MADAVREAFEALESAPADPERKANLVGALMELGRAKAQAHDFPGAEETLRQAAEKAHSTFGKGSERVERVHDLLLELLELQGLTREQAIARVEGGPPPPAGEDGGWGAWAGIPSQLATEWGLSAAWT